MGGLAGWVAERRRCRVRSPQIGAPWLAQARPGLCGLFCCRISLCSCHRPCGPLTAPPALSPGAAAPRRPRHQLHGRVLAPHRPHHGADLLRGRHAAGVGRDGGDAEDGDQAAGGARPPTRSPLCEARLQVAGCSGDGACNAGPCCRPFCCTLDLLPRCPTAGQELTSSAICPPAKGLPAFCPLPASQSALACCLSPALAAAGQAGAGARHELRLHGRRAAHCGRAAGWHDTAVGCARWVPPACVAAAIVTAARPAGQPGRPLPRLPCALA